MSSSERPARPPLVLIASDQEWSVRSIESILAPNGYAVLRAYTGAQAVERAVAAMPDLVILDAQMPDLNGIEVCRQLRSESGVGDSVPIIVTTSGPSGRSQRLDAYRAGAWEFLGQPLDGEALLLKLEQYIRSKFAMDRVRDESLIDNATGLYNMRGLARRAREIGSDAYRRHGALACVVFSPDPVKGERLERSSDETTRRVVKWVGDVMRAKGRVADAIGRLGRAEFAVIAPDTESEGAVRLMLRLGESIEGHPLDLGEEGEQPLRIRAGYFAVQDFRESSVDAVEMLLRATTALRHLRTEGNGERIRSYDQVPLRLSN